MASLLKTKRLGWGVTFVLVTLTAVLAYFSGVRYLAAVQAVEHTLAIESAINGTLSLLKDAETGQRGYILTGDPQFLEPYNAAQSTVPSYFESLVAVTGDDPEQAPRLSALKALIEEKHAFIEETVRFRREGQTDQALVLVRGGLGKRLMDRIREECRAMLDHEAKILAARKIDARNAEVTTMFGVGLGSAAMVLFALFSWVTVHRDVEALRQATGKLARSEAHFRLLAEHGSDLVRLLDLKGAVTYVSPSVERLLGYEVDEYLALSPRSLLHPDELETARSIVREIESGKQREGISTYRIRNKSGEYRWFEVRWEVRVDETQQPLDIHTAGRDVTARIAADEQLHAYASALRGLSLRDELTDLYNRRGFIEVGGHAHTQAQRDRRPAALIFVDLNGMKRINDEQGHDIGDQALVDAAQVLTASLGEADVVARLGGDEFVAFALDFTATELDALRLRLRRAADLCVIEFNRSFRLSMSVGAAYLPVGSQLTLEELLERADAAMYEQKNARRAAGNVSLFPPARNNA